MADMASVVTSAAVGAVVSYGGAIINNILNTRAKVDEGLRETRIRVYQDLWKKTHLLPKWPRRTDVTYEMLQAFSQQLCDWYFDQGGMFLSKKARDSYGQLQDTVGAVLKQRPKGLIDSEGADYKQVRVQCSRLRTELTADLLSRRAAPRLGW